MGSQPGPTSGINGWSSSDFWGQEPASRNSPRPPHMMSGDFWNLRYFQNSPNSQGFRGGGPCAPERSISGRRGVWDSGEVWDFGAHFRRIRRVGFGYPVENAYGGALGVFGGAFSGAPIARFTGGPGHIRGLEIDHPRRPSGAQVLERLC